MVGFGFLFKNAIVPLDRLINSIVMSIGSGRIGGGVDGLGGSTIVVTGHSGPNECEDPEVDCYV
eukprot:14980106-Ditylum_brightwellii.AAC.1